MVSSQSSDFYSHSYGSTKFSPEFHETINYKPSDAPEEEAIIPYKRTDEGVTEKNRIKNSTSESSYAVKRSRSNAESPGRNKNTVNLYIQFSTEPYCRYNFNSFYMRKYIYPLMGCAIDPKVP